jgi:hypothetical protein
MIAQERAPLKEGAAPKQEEHLRRSKEMSNNWTVL